MPVKSPRTGIFILGRDTALAGRGRISAPSRVSDDCSPTRTLGGIVTHRDSGPGRTRARSAALRVGPGQQNGHHGRARTSFMARIEPERVLGMAAALGIVEGRGPPR